MSLSKEQANWLQLLAKKSDEQQKMVLTGCKLDVIRYLHNLIKFVTYDKNVKISPRRREILVQKFIVFKKILCLV